MRHRIEVPRQIGLIVRYGNTGDSLETPQISLFPNRIDLLPSCAELVIGSIVFIFPQTWNRIQLAGRDIYEAEGAKKGNHYLYDFAALDAN